MNAVMAQPLRVLVVANQEPWPLNHGGRLHLYHVLRELAPTAAVTLALTTPPIHRDRLPSPLQTVVIPSTDDSATPQEHGARGLAARHFGWSRAIAAWLTQHAVPERFDVVMLNGAVLGLYADVCRAPVVWNVQDELVLPTLRVLRHEPLSAWPARLRAALVYAAFESHTIRRAAATICVSSLDAAWARTFAPLGRVDVIENGVDLDYFASRGAEPGAPHPGALTFIGAQDFAPNIDAVRWFISTIWPRLAAHDPARRLAIVGRDPTPEVVAACAAPGVELHANVPDTRPFLHAASLVVVPVRQGGGLKNKILEACAAGRPVVTTPQGLGGLSARPGVDLVVARNPREWVRRIEELLGTPELANRFAINGRRWVRARHDWAQAGRHFLAVLHKVAARGRAHHCTLLPSGAGGASCR